MRLILAAAFAGVALVWLVAEGAAYGHARDIARAVSEIGDNALASIRLVERMGMDVERRRALVAECIFEKRPEAMARIERELAAARADYELAANEYAPLSHQPREREASVRLARDVASVDEPIAAAVALARADRGDEARASVLEMEPSFAAIERDVNDLVDLDRTEAEHAQAAIVGLQGGATTFQLALTLLALGATVLLGVWVTRTVARHERQLRDDARELDAFAGRVAHDLRGPLGTVNLALAAIEKEATGVDAPVGVLRRCVTRMDHLIGDLLKLSRIGATSADSVADAGAVAAAVEEDVRHQAGEVDLALRVDVEPARVRCDEGLLREVLWNLCENALKYRREGVQAHIDVTGRAKPGVYHLRVADNGTGMSPEDARQAFDPFFRAQRARSTPGTGLGLSIVKRVVEVSGGTVSVRSREGEGATFLVELPLAR